MIYTILVILHVIVSFLLVIVILLQNSKGGGLSGAAFGGGGSSMAFLGARGTATLLTRATTVLAILFMLNSLGLSFLLGGSGKAVSVTQREIQSSAKNLPTVAGGADMNLNQEPIPQGTQTQPSARPTTPTTANPNQGTAQPKK